MVIYLNMKKISKPIDTQNEKASSDVHPPKR